MTTPTLKSSMGPKSASGSQSDTQAAPSERQQDVASGSSEPTHTAPSEQQQDVTSGFNEPTHTAPKDTDDIISSPVMTTASRSTGGSGQHSSPLPRSRKPTLPARFVSYGLIGQGGYGSVFRVFDKERGEYLALKVLKQQDAGAMMRFKSEFRETKSVVHENLVKLFNLIHHAGRWMISMELIEGGVSFVDYIRERAVASTAETLAPADLENLGKPLLPRNNPPIRINPQRPKTVLSESRVPKLRASLIGVVRGLMAIHAAGKIHRDIKPQNVLVTPDGRVVILDFGLIVDPEETAQNYRSRFEIMGTPEYMAPEQAAGKLGSPASDFYDVGTMMYEALVGRLPFPGRTALQILSSKQLSDPPDIRDSVPYPLLDLADLCMALINRDPAKRPEGPDILKVLGDDKGVDTSGVTTTVSTRSDQLVGRAKEMATLIDNLEHVRTSGISLMMWIKGRSGVGKTSLLQGFTDQVRSSRRAIVLRGRCFDAETVPYKALDALVDQLTQYLDALNPTEMSRFADLDLSPLVLVFPVLQKVFPSVDNDLYDDDSSAGADGAWEIRERAFSALSTLLDRVAEGKPLVAWVDDVQWGDVDSAQFFRDLTNNTQNIMLILSFREEAVDGSPFLKTLFTTVVGKEHDAVAREMFIQPLNLDQSEDLALQRLPYGLPDSRREMLATEIAKTAAGSPFFILEMCRYAEKMASSFDGSKSNQTVLYQGLRDRVEQLSASARSLLQLTCVAAKATSTKVLGMAAGLQTKLPPLLDELQQAHLIQSQAAHQGALIEPYHSRIREWVVKQIEQEDLWKLHLRLAQALEHHGATSLDAMANHYRLGGDKEKAWTYTVKAADRAASQLAFVHTVNLYKKALELSPDRQRNELHAKLAETLANAGFGLEAAHIWRKLIPKSQTEDEAIELRAKAANQLLRIGQVTDGLSLFRDLLEYAHMRVTKNRYAAILLLVWGRFRLWVRGTKFQHNPTPDPELLKRIDIAWSVSMGLSNVDVLRAAELQTRVVRLALDGGEPSRAVRALCGEASFVSTGGPKNRTRAERLIEEAQHVAEMTDDPVAETFIHAARGLAGWFFGNWKRARDEMLKVIAISERTPGSWWELTTGRHYTCWSLYNLGELSRMKRLVHTWLPDAIERNDTYSAASLRLFMSNVVWLMADDPGQARANAEAALETWKQEDYQAQHYYGWYALSHVDLYERRLEKALQETERTRKLLHQSFLYRIQTVSIEFERTRGKLLLAAIDEGIGDRQQLLAGVAQSAKRLAKIGLPYSTGAAAHLEAALAFQRGDRSRATRLLRRAFQKYEESSMQLYKAGVMWQLGQLVRGDERDQLMKEAHAWFVSQGIAAPDRFAYMLSPGFGRQTDNSATHLPTSRANSEGNDDTIDRNDPEVTNPPTGDTAH